MANARLLALWRPLQFKLPPGANVLRLRYLFLLRYHPQDSNCIISFAPGLRKGTSRAILGKLSYSYKYVSLNTLMQCICMQCLPVRVLPELPSSLMDVLHDRSPSGDCAFWLMLLFFLESASARHTGILNKRHPPVRFAEPGHAMLRFLPASSSEGVL